MTPAGKDPAKLLESEMARHHYASHALIEILHAAQQIYGFLSAPLLKEIARKLRMPPSRVFGVATFYHLFRFHPAAPHTASVCMGTACYVEGAAELGRHRKEQRMGSRYGALLGMLRPRSPRALRRRSPYPGHSRGTRKTSWTRE